jgi:RNA exonuclease 1
MAALDCEMCQTTQGMEVTRLTLVDDQRRVLLDAFVKPYNPITDYHTRFSGITPEIMAGCETRLEQVQVALLRLVRADTVLVGHSLEQDLLVTGLIHLRCIDTSLLYPHPRGHHCRYALRVLVKKYLHRCVRDRHYYVGKE